MYSAYVFAHLQVNDHLSRKQNLLPSTKPELNSKQPARIILNVKLKYPKFQLWMKDYYSEFSAPNPIYFFYFYLFIYFFCTMKKYEQLGEN